MNRRQALLGIFAAVAALQIAVPLSMIAKREITLREGVPFKFRTAPVDPYDAFRGRYVSLQVEAAHHHMANAGMFERGQRVYAQLETDKDGFALIRKVVAGRPAEGDFIQARVQYASGTNLSLKCPFDRYYLPEKIAPEAERAYWSNSNRTNRNAYSLVRVRSGFAALEDLIVDGLPILEFVRQHKQP
jgi:uncharacterized membrane-anchored protein